MRVYVCARACVMPVPPLPHPPPLQSKWTRIPRRRKRGPKFEGYQLHIRGALAAADARKTRLVLDGLGGRHQDTTGTQVGGRHYTPQQFLSAITTHHEHGIALGVGMK